MISMGDESHPSVTDDKGGNEDEKKSEEESAEESEEKNGSGDGVVVEKLEKTTYCEYEEYEYVLTYPFCPGCCGDWVGGDWG